MPLLLEAFAAEKVLVADLVGPALVQRLDILDHPACRACAVAFPPGINGTLGVPQRSGGSALHPQVLVNGGLNLLLSRFRVFLGVVPPCR